jgi:hypothetical protein
MPGITLNSPLNVNQSNSSTDVLGPMETAIDQTRGQTADFSSKLTDPNFSGKSEMGLMLKLQREIQLETQMYTAVSNCMKARDDAKRGAISNFK